MSCDSNWIISLVSTLSGTLLGWLLQFVRKRKLYIKKIKIKPKSVTCDKSIKNAYFQLNIYNSSDYEKAIRNASIMICLTNKQKKIEQIQNSQKYNSINKKNNSQKHATYKDLIVIPAHSSISKDCEIEFYSFSEKVDKAYLIYENEKFIKKKIKVKWIEKGDK